MRPRRWIPLLAFALCVTVGPALAQTQAPTLVKLATLVPDGSVWDKILKTMGSEWSRDTQGRVQLRVYPGGGAGDEPDVVRGMRVGRLQAAALTTIGLTEIDPAFKMFAIPMFFDSYEELNAVLTKLEPVLKQRLEAKGFVLLNWGYGGWVYFFTKQPVETVDQLKKTKMFVWAGDEALVQVWKNNGYRPVALATTDVLTGLQTGMIDAYPNTPLIVLTLQWFKFAPHMVGVGLAPLVGGMVMTKQAWAKISEADRAAILTACRAAEVKLKVEVPKQDSTAILEMEKRGLVVTRVSPSAAAAWRAAAEGLAASVKSTIPAPEVVDLATRERDAVRQRSAGSPH